MRFYFCIKNAWIVFNFDSNYLIHTSTAHSNAVNKSRRLHCFFIGTHQESGKTHVECIKNTHAETHLECRNCGDLAIRLAQNLYSDRFCLPTSNRVNFNILISEMALHSTLETARFGTVSGKSGTWQLTFWLMLLIDLVQALAHSVTARRALWLCHWRAGGTSQAFDISYNGRLLFSQTLNNAIKRMTGGKVWTVATD